MKKQIVIGITGATGVAIGIRLLEILKENDSWQTHLVLSRGAEITIGLETDSTLEYVKSLADVVYDNSNIGSAIASGSFKTKGMIICPCSMKTLGGVASGYTDNLLLRSADVMLKERKKLVLVTRETPLNYIHIKNMQEVTLAGGIILPPMMTFYQKPETIEDMIDHLCGKILDQFEIELKSFKRWK